MWLHHPRKACAFRGSGFTLIELITILGLVGILAAVVLPRFVSSQSYRELLLKDQLISVARFAQQTALSRYGQRVCLQLSLQPGTTPRWLFEVWAGDDLPSLPATQCFKTVLVKQLTSEQGGSTLLLGSTPIGTTPVTIRYDGLGNLVGQSANLRFSASGRNACITLAGFAYAATDGAACDAN